MWYLFVGVIIVILLLSLRVVAATTILPHLSLSCVISFQFLIPILSSTPYSHIFLSLPCGHFPWKEMNSRNALNGSFFFSTRDMSKSLYPLIFIFIIIVKKNFYQKNKIFWFQSHVCTKFTKRQLSYSTFFKIGIIIR